jgi:transposase
VAALQQTTLYAYRLPAAMFHPGAPHAHVAEGTVEPLGPPERVGDLLACHAAAGIQLRLLDNLWPFWDAVVTSTAGFSGIRLRNARVSPRPAGP